MLNSTDKKKIDKILGEKIEEYKKEIKDKNKGKIEIKATEIKNNPPVELIERIKELKRKKEELKKLERETKEAFPGWELADASSWRSDNAEYVLSLTSRTESYSPDGSYRNTDYLTIYEHPELKKIQEKITESEKEIVKLGSNATLELYLGSQPPLDIMEKLDTDVRAIINKVN